MSVIGRLVKAKTWESLTEARPRERFNRIVVAAGLLVTPIVFLIDISISRLTGHPEMTLHQIPYVATIAISAWQYRRPHPNADWLLYPVAVGMMGLHSWEMWRSVDVGGVSFGATTAVVVVIGIVNAASSPSAWPRRSLLLASIVMIWGAWGGIEDGLNGFDAYLQGVVPALAIALGAWLVHDLTSALERSEVESRHAARFHAAIAACADALKEPSDSIPDQALLALLDATDAASVFITRNVEDPVLGLCSSMIGEVLADGVPPDPTDQWAYMPWTRMPYSFDALSSGRSIYFSITDTSPDEQALYRGTGVNSECNIPVMIDGEWHGILGLSYMSDHEFRQSDFELLETAAGLVGAYWKAADQRVELERLITSKDELIAAVSHELRTPLTAILGFSEQLLDGEDEHGNEFIDLIAQQSRDMANIIEDLLVSARVDLSDVTIMAQTLDLTVVAKSVVDATTPVGRSIDLDVDDEPVLASADPVRVRQIVRNLLSNAFQHGGQSIRVSATHEGEWAQVAVWDSGSSISGGEADRLFERFYTGQRPRMRPGSVGLGLFLSRRLARLMGGDLLLDISGAGTTFALRLPIVTHIPVDMEPAVRRD